MAKKNNDTWLEDDYKRYVLRYLQDNGSMGDYYRVRIAEAYDYFYNKITNTKYTDLLTIHEDDTGIWGDTPFTPINFDSIHPKIMLMVGELQARGFDPHVDAVDKKSIERKRAYEAQLRYFSQAQGLHRKLAQYTGVEYGVNENLPMSSEQIAQHMEQRKDLYEALVEDALKDGIRTHKYEGKRNNYFLDVLVANRCHGKIETYNEYARPRRINPLNFIPDYSSEDDYLDDAQVAVEAYYISIPEAIDKFNIPEEHMLKMLEDHKMGQSNYAGVTSSQGSMAFAPFIKNKGKYKDYDVDRVLVIEAEWLSNEDITKKVTYDKYGNRHAHIYYGDNKNAKLTGKEKKDKRNEVVKKPLQVVRYAVMVGDEHMVEYGRKGNYIRDPENPAITKLNYVSFIHSYNNQDSVSLVERLRDLQDFKNYILTVMQKEITTTIGSIVAVDIASIPDFYKGKDKKGRESAAKNLIQGAKAYGVMLYDSSIDSNYRRDPNVVPIKNVEPRQQGLIKDCIQMAAYIDQQMMLLTGINDARQGLAPERQLASTNEQKLTQSNMITDTYFEGFRGWEERLLQKWCETIVMLWKKHPDRYEHIALRQGRNLPDDFKRIDLNSYRVRVLTQPIPRQQLMRMMEAALAQGNLAPPDYLELSLMVANGDTRQAIERFIRSYRQREKMMMQQQQQMQQAELQAKQAEQMNRIRGDLQLQQLKGSQALRTVQENNRTNMDKTELELNQKDRAEVNNRMIVQDQMENEGNQ